MQADQNQHFAGRLKELREKAGITQQQLGVKAGIHKLTVAKLEQGIREPSWATVQTLSTALGVTCEAFSAKLEKPEDAGKRPRGRPTTAEAEEQPIPKKPAAKKK
jgi:transcriptional regulator with XRE-family HTH domain